MNISASILTSIITTAVGFVGALILAQRGFFGNLRSQSYALQLESTLRIIKEGAILTETSYRVVTVGAFDPSTVGPDKIALKNAADEFRRHVYEEVALLPIEVISAAFDLQKTAREIAEKDVQVIIDPANAGKKAEERPLSKEQDDLSGKVYVQYSAMVNACRKRLHINSLEKEGAASDFAEIRRRY